MFPFVPVHKIIESTGIGVDIDEELWQQMSGIILLPTIRDVLATEDDLAKLHNPVITYNKEETFRRYNLVGDILGDILPVKLMGVDYFAFTPG